MPRSVRSGGRVPLLRVAATPVRAFFWAALVVFAPAKPAAPATHATVVLSPYEKAERLHDALEACPEDERTRQDYERVLEAYRVVYHEDPASLKADASIYAVAGLLAEQGRTLHDEKSLHDAIGQYEFLRREYPGSRYRFNALVAEGDIYWRDLNEPAAAKSAYQQLVKSAPESAAAAQARLNLRALRAGESFAKNSSAPPISQARTAQASKPPSPAKKTPETNPKSKKQSTVLAAAIQSQSEVAPAPPPKASGAQNQVNEQERNPEQAPVVSEQQPVKHTVVDATVEAPIAAPRSHKGRLPLVTGVRHWSTPVYTRVAIDMQDEVQYEAARVPSPDRIFFDLHGARLSPELVGKSFQVTDDGFLKRIRAAQFSNDVTRIVLDVSDVSDYSAFLLPNPYRLIIDIHGRKPGTVPPQGMSNAEAPPARTVPSTSPSAPPVVSKPPEISSVPSAAGSSPTPNPNASTRDIASLSHQPDQVKATSHPTTAPIADSVAGTSPASQPGLPTSSPTASHHKSKPNQSGSVSTPNETSNSIHEADPTAAGNRSMVRALGLKIGRIVVDAGHGGHDSGTLGPDGIEEKDIVLDVSLRLGKLLKQRLGADVIFTRDDDTFIPLETRTAIANKAQADLFISVHANSSQDSSARGVETYYLNFTSSPESLEVAARENAVSQQSVHQLSDLVKKIALHEKIDESREFASDVQSNLYDGLEQGNPGLKDRGVKQAPFVVLIGANMPSILAEISFLTNPDDEHELGDPRYRQRIAESLYRGVARYVSGLSGVRLAEAHGHNAGN